MISINKYIDADRLIRKIKGQIRLENLNFAALGGGGQTFCINTLEWVLKQIDSLQQEQPEKPTKKNCNNCPYCIERKDQIGWHFRGCFGGQYKGKPIAEIEECPLQQEQQKDICHKCIHHGKDDDYCYYPRGGMQRLINENGVYECTGFCETEQEQPEIDLEKEIEEYWSTMGWNKVIEIRKFRPIARYFYELGQLNSK